MISETQWRAAGYDYDPESRYRPLLLAAILPDDFELVPVGEHYDRDDESLQADLGLKWASWRYVPRARTGRRITSREFLVRRRRKSGAAEQP